MYKKNDQNFYIFNTKFKKYSLRFCSISSLIYVCVLQYNTLRCNILNIRTRGEFKIYGCIATPF